MSAHVCPTCHRTIRAAKPAPAIAPASLSDAELYAHFKKTAPAGDVAFFLARVSLSPAVRIDAEALAADMRARNVPRAEVYRRLTSLQDRWRREYETVYRTVVLPAERLARRLARARIGSERRPIAA